MSGRPMITCLRCSRYREHSSRTLCGRCERRSYQDGSILDYPRNTLSSKDIIEEMGSPAWAGQSFVDIAMAMGLSRPSAQTSYRRARKRGWTT